MKNLALIILVALIPVLARVQKTVGEIPDPTPINE